MPSGGMVSRQITGARNIIPRCITYEITTVKHSTAPMSLRGSRRGSVEIPKQPLFLGPNGVAVPTKKHTCPGGWCRECGVSPSVLHGERPGPDRMYGKELKNDACLLRYMFCAFYGSALSRNAQRNASLRSFRPPLCRAVVSNLLLLGIASPQRPRLAMADF